MAQRRSLYGIPDKLWRQAKATAAEQGISLSDWIEEAMRKKLRKEGKITRLTGEDAIEYAEYHGFYLSKKADSVEEERIDDITSDEADQMTRDNLPSENIYLDI